MDSFHQTSLNAIKKFTDVLFNQRQSIKALSQAYSLIADDFGIGRVMGDIPKSTSNNELLLLAENRIIFMSDRGFDPKDSISFAFSTISNAEGHMLVSPVPGHVFSDEEKEVLNTILQITDIHICRYYAFTQIEESALLQRSTGLPNAIGFMRIAGRKISDTTISDYDAYYFNLTGFGVISKRYGEKEADTIILRFTKRLKEFIVPGEILGHLGGDNFVALIEQGDRSDKFRQLLSGVDIPIDTIDGMQETIRISARAGYMHVKLPISPDYIIGGPTIALSHAKLNRLPFVELTEEISESATRAKSIELNFDKALANNEFTVFYQPKVNTETGDIIGAEALVRWYENGRLVAPIGFVPVLERSSKIIKLDMFILERVCKDIHEWKKDKRKIVPISVNFSRKDLVDKNLPEKIEDVINKYDIDNNDIVIEVTETASEEEKVLMKSFLSRLNDYGIETSIDDFGTGYSSLSALREYPIGEIKIDRSFINRDLDLNDEIIIRSVIEMAQKLDIDVITEGVELVAQKEFLHRLGCDRVQGFLYDKPLPKNVFEERMEKGNYANIQDYVKKE